MKKKKSQIRYQIKKLEKEQLKNPNWLSSEFMKAKERLYKELHNINKIMGNLGLVASQNKDQRIACLAIFRDLPHIEDEKKRMEKTFELVEMLFKEYPFPPLPDEKVGDTGDNKSIPF